jgi:hypothetical protein
MRRRSMKNRIVLGAKSGLKHSALPRRRCGDVFDHMVDALYMPVLQATWFGELNYGLWGRLPWNFLEDA